MALKQTLINRILTISTNQTLHNCRISSSSTAVPHLFPPPLPSRPDPEPGEDQPLFHSFLRPKHNTMLEKLKEMDITKGRIRLDGLSPPPEAPPKITVADAKKLLRVSLIEKLKVKLSLINKDNVEYGEFVEMCVDGCGDRDQGLDVAKALDDSGSVIVLGNVVFLKPQQVVKAIYGLLPTNLSGTHDLPVKELEEMELWKSAIDTKAKRMVQRELWGGLAYLMVQTAGFMRLTFWELSWDVMEPICFYVTSIYFMGGYAFFLRTAKEPSFEGFFQSRFSSKQKKLMKRQGFDLEKYNKLRNACESLVVDEGARKSINMNIN